MSSPGIRPRNHEPTAASSDKSTSPQKLRVLSEEGARVAAPSIVMPRAKTELTEMLAGDKLLCVRPRGSTIATRRNADARSGVSAADAGSHSESPVTNSGQQSPNASLPAYPAGGDLARVVDVWPGLPGSIRAAILAMIRETATDNA